MHEVIATVALQFWANKYSTEHMMINLNAPILGLEYSTEHMINQTACKREAIKQPRNALEKKTAM